MRRNTTFLAAWLLLLIPALLVGWVALRSVRSEGARLAAAERDAATDRAASIAATLDLSVAEVRRGLLETLATFPEGEALASLLEEWRSANPLVRNVFVWRTGEGLRFPPPSWPRGDEDRGFADRYRALFQGQADWGQPPTGETGAEGTVGGVSSSLPGRRQLRELAVQEVGASAADAIATPRRPTGWVPWYAENRLHFLGWAKLPGGNLRYGLELELMALLSRLLPDFPVPTAPGEEFTLLDGSGRVFHQTGSAPDPEGLRIAVPVGPELPHWQVAVAWPEHAGGGFALLSTLLVGSFVAAILLGGSLLLWQARRQWRDAQQKTSFVSNVSHELKTPLTTIRMYAELLAERRVRDPDKRRDYLAVIVSESQRLTRLVNNVLEFGRLEQGRKRYHRVPLDLAVAVREVLRGLEPRLQEAGMELRGTRILEAAPAHSDRDALEQILLNLFDNSLKYAAEGLAITVEIEPTHEGWMVRVGDRGPGIPAAHRQRVFDTFHRVDDSLTAEQPGSGLGLSIARQLARDLGGDLTCRDRDGGGTWFELTVPVSGEVQR